MTEYEQVFQSPLNNSASKAIYSFPKTQRFQKEQPPICDKFYEIPSTRTTRTSGFGLGNKFGLASKQATPPSNQYNQKSEFDQKKRGYSFTSRPKSGGIFDKNAGFAPGPGHYKPQEQRLERSVSYSIGRAVTLQHNDNKVGPGKYDISPSITKDGTYFLSKYRNSRCGRIGSAKRWSDQSSVKKDHSSSQIKLQQSYNTKELILSKFKKGSQVSFARSLRPRIVSNNGPGPGSYNLFSEFGARKK